MFNLKVEDNPVFFAEGVLVHNCDSAVMAIARFRSGGFIRLPSDRWDDEYETRQRRASYY